MAASQVKSGGRHLAANAQQLPPPMAPVIAKWYQIAIDLSDANR